MARAPIRHLLLAAAFSLGAFALGTTNAGAQVSDSQQDHVQMMAEQIAELMTALQTRAADYPAFIADLEDGLATIEQADEQVQELIDQLTTATDQMEDGSEFDTAIDDYVAATTELIAEAEASNNDAIKDAIPDLQQNLENLEQVDEDRAATVIEARNLIRTLEQNREAIAFFIRANQVQRAAALIRANVDDFSQIVENGRVLAEGLIGAANP